ncbi:MAG: DUF2764 family protein [Endomicrobiales bacterium]|nr:DUF2764 family protein [Endomicrobiales bacterium]
MAVQYYYLVSSLPLLKINEEPSITSSDFIGLCEPWVGKKDLSMVSGASIEEPFLKGPSHEVLRRWSDFEKNLRNTLVVSRAKKLGLEVKHFTRSGDDLDGALEQKVTEISQERSPFTAERKLIGLRWNFLDMLESDHHFDAGYLIIYFLKLQLIERLNRFTKERGTTYFQKAVLDSDRTLQ